MNRAQPGPMARKFIKANLEAPQKDQPPLDSLYSEVDWSYYPFQSQYYFFYGSLMDPATLARVLQLPEAPRLRPAKVIGYHTELWGPYPALLDGPPLHSVEGFACEILQKKHSDLLQAYETVAYCLKPCFIDLLDGVHGVETVEGATFIWDGDRTELRDGDFNLKHYLREQSLERLD
ncbi:hypothetical protein N7456_007237 [Penicillium angulare]|uniref:Putative gamma-glutamylcyclotransferase n=1 Tax=Penicillium angulare TaxID=116970 RepID=A0A9W9FJA6_9EURO|nr:hypothetical protein N7456_007237 [Penicillium angulare]